MPLCCIKSRCNKYRMLLSGGPRHSHKEAPGRHSRQLCNQYENKIFMARWRRTTSTSECIRYIASLVCANESPGNRVLYLTQLCGVCKRWRHELCGQTSLPLSFDGATDAGGVQKGSTLLKFRRTELVNKRCTLLGASKLLSGRDN